MILFAGTKLQLRANLLGGAAASTFFDVKGVFRAASVAPCERERLSWSISTTAYDATTMTQHVGVVLHDGGAIICIELMSFGDAQSMVPPPQVCYDLFNSWIV